MQCRPEKKLFPFEPIHETCCGINYKNFIMVYDFFFVIDNDRWRRNNKLRVVFSQRLPAGAIIIR
jgi:hypothetical protein